MAHSWHIVSRIYGIFHVLQLSPAGVGRGSRHRHRERGDT